MHLAYGLVLVRRDLPVPLHLFTYILNQCF